MLKSSAYQYIWDIKGIQRILYLLKNLKAKDWWMLDYLHGFYTQRNGLKNPEDWSKG